MSWGAIGGAAIGAVASYAGSKRNAKAAQDAANTPWTENRTQTQTAALDPRISSAIFGGEGNSGILGQALSQIGSGQTPGQTAFGQGMDQYLGGWGANNFTRSQQMAQNLQEVQRQAPMAGWSGDAGAVQGVKVDAPGQNKLDLAGDYRRMISGDSAANPYLTKSLQSGIDQSNQAFRTNLGDITDTLQRQILPGIRGGAIASGQYGGSRQGIAEGLALSDFSKRAASAAEQLGLANIAATTGAQAGEYSRGQDRSLNALNTLSGQQYGVAAQNAQLAQQAALANQAAAAANADRNLRRDTANQGAVLQTNQQNDARNIAGVGLSSGLLGQAANYVNQSNNADLNRLGQVSGILNPYLNVGATSTTTTTGSGTGQPQPVYQNTGANVLGGAAAGLGLFNQFKNAFGGQDGGGLPSMANAGQYSWGQY